MRMRSVMAAIGVITIAIIAVLLWCWPSDNRPNRLSEPTRPVVTPTVVLTQVSTVESSEASEFYIQIQLAETISGHHTIWLDARQAGLIVIFDGPVQSLSLKPDDSGAISYHYTGAAVPVSGLVKVYAIGDTSPLKDTILPFRIINGRLVVLQADGKTAWPNNRLPMSSQIDHGTQDAILLSGCADMACALAIVQSSDRAWPQIQPDCQAVDGFEVGEAIDITQTFRATNGYSIGSGPFQADHLQADGWFCQNKEWTFYVRARDASLFQPSGGQILPIVERREGRPNQPPFLLSFYYISTYIITLK